MISGDGFFKTLTEAIDDIMAHGFDASGRLEKWIGRLRASANQSLGPTESIRKSLVSSLTRVFSNATTTKKLLRLRPGVSHYTLENIKPKLRAELSRRILASADLIKMNRETEIAKTLHRFAGWATSIPKGGADAKTRAKARVQIRRGLAGLPFAERRVIVDQGHKLVATVNNIVAVDTGAIALIWQHVQEKDYDGRPEHVARDGRIYLLRDSWAVTRGYIKRENARYYDQVDPVGAAPFCRCTAVYLYALRDLPVSMLTAKGKGALSEARKAIHGV